MNYFITAIGTDSGKTLVSAIVCEVLGADYWKPVQAGLEETDSSTIGHLVSKDITVYPEQFCLTEPMSPHAAAKKDGVEITVNKFIIPITKNHLVIEGAGGLLVPLNDQDTMADLISHLDVEIILVCNLYLGSINHSLLTIAEIKRRGLKVKGIVFNGPGNQESEAIILKHSGWECILRIEEEAVVNKKVVQNYAQRLQL